MRTLEVSGATTAIPSFPSASFGIRIALIWLHFQTALGAINEALTVFMKAPPDSPGATRANGCPSSPRRWPRTETVTETRHVAEGRTQAARADHRRLLRDHQYGSEGAALDRRR